jgi:hypothetical protein
MAAIGTPRPHSQYIFPSSAHPQQSQEKKPRSSLPRRPATSHYRPVSQVLSDDAKVTQPHSTKQSRRDSFSLLMSLPSYPLREKTSKSKDKGREREREQGGGQGGGHLRIPSHENKSLPDKERTPHLRHLTSKPSLTSLHNVIDIPPHRNHQDNLVLRTEDTFVRKRVWHRHGSMTMHPYPNDAVYMQSYDPVMLDK